MPHDPFQIALEHHRAGRLRQAESEYRALLESNPNDADALHWLGVLLFQAGEVSEAVTLLERATSFRPSDPAFQYNLGQAYMSGGRTAEAIEAFNRATNLDANRSETLIALAHAHLARQHNGDADAAIAALRRAHAAGLDTAELHHSLGVALLAAGKPHDAITSLRTALAKDPNHAPSYQQLAQAHRAIGQTNGVRKFLMKALEIDPDRAAAWHALGMLDVEAGHLARAVDLFRRAVRAKPSFEPGYQAMAQVLKRLGRSGEAKEAMRLAERAAQAASNPTSVADLEQRITPDERMERLHHALADVTGLVPPANVPAEQISALFDKYADRFDEHLQGTLQYHVPELLVHAVAAVIPAGRLLDAMDLGCGTGLCGPLLRPMAATLRGVDLSTRMIARARAREVYDSLEVGDLVAALRRFPRAFDLLTAADVLNYVGDLAPMMEAASTALRPGGLFAFSVEREAGERFHLQKQTHRWAHSKAYLQHVARIYGFEITLIEPIVVRLEKEEPLAGYMLLLKQPEQP